jgi:3-methylfumaryl-CoA hydratase
MSAIDQAAIDSWRAAIGRQEVQFQRLEAESLRRYALAVGGDPDIERIAPPLAHWAFFLPGPCDDAIGEDGHPTRGGFLPAVTLPRRMFAAAAIRFEAPLLVGELAELASAIADVTHKSGRSGDLVFVEVDRVLTQDGVVRVRERQSYVYRGAGDPTPMPQPSDAPIEGVQWRPSETHLFRFSAVTFNGHRIHYDQPYATRVEGYPALVVQGPFTAAKLAGLAQRRGALASFAFRAQAPLFVGQPIYLQSSDSEVRATRCDGAVALTAQISYR